MKYQMILMVGNVGSGKSTVAKALAQCGYKVVSKDAIRLMLNGGVYKFDRDFEPTVKGIERKVLEDLLVHQHKVVVDNTNLTVDARAPYVVMGKNFQYRMVALVMPRLTKEIAMSRKQQNSFGLPVTEWEQVWEGMNKSYVPPSYGEGLNVKDMDKHTAVAIVTTFPSLRVVNWLEEEVAVETIRKMNPGKHIPSGAELAAKLRNMK